MVQSGEFLDHTTNRVDYNKKKGERSQAIRPLEHLVQSGEFSGNTTHKVDYGAKEVWWSLVQAADFMLISQAERQMPFRPTQHAIQSGDFEGTTTHRVDYERKQGERSKAFRPTRQPMESGPFEVLFLVINLSRKIWRVIRQIVLTTRGKMEKDRKPFVLLSTSFNLASSLGTLRIEWITTGRKGKDQDQLGQKRVA